MDYISAKEAANKWGVSDVIARKYCRQKRIPGAKYQNGAWLIPEHAKKPKPMVSNSVIGARIGYKNRRRVLRRFFTFT